MCWWCRGDRGSGTGTGTAIATDAWKPRGTRREPELRDIDHAQHPVGRVGRPEDVAALAAYLVSEEAAFVTGQCFVIDGGMMRKMIYEE